MKLKDWDHEEEKDGETIKDREQRKGSDLQGPDLETGDSGQGNYGSPLRQNKGRADIKKQADAAPSLRRRALEPQEDEGTEELAPLPPWAKALVFIGLAVLAAVICAILWQLVHPDKPQEGDQGILAQTDEPRGEDADQTREADGNPASNEGGEPTAGPATAPESGAASEPTATQAPVQAQSPAPSEAPGQSASSGQQEASGQPAPSQAPAGDTVQPPTEGNAGMSFSPVQESVTPKEAVNLRTAPSTADEANIVVKISNGEVLARTGINNDTGWSQIDYNGQTLYAVSQYLTTDLNYKTPVTPADPNRVTTADGTVVIFENCDDWITPKEYVNLRTEPSTLQEDATVSCQLLGGEKAHRTGYSPDFGWSRVEYNGQVLYVVTSFVYVVPME